MRRKNLTVILARNIAGFSLLWVVLTEASLYQVWMGFGFVLLASISVLWLQTPGDTPFRFHLLALTHYLTYFIYHSLTGGIDVSYRALRLKRNVHPTYLNYPLRIPSSNQTARILFAMSICIFPGSLSCAFRENLLVIHLLDEDLSNLESIERLEELIARLFSIQLLSSDRI